MSNINQLSGAIRFALFVGAASSLATVSAFAQEAATTDAKTLDRIEVTGSRIRQVNTETTQPVQVVTRADIEKTGLNNVYDVLNTLTSSDGSGLSTVTTQTNGSDGSQQVSLRGLGAQRTLILVDGHRWATDIDQTVDLSTIPLAIIERIDVLKDGASAIYGSDAIAGVINIITRKNYEGAQVGAYFGQTEKGDGDRSAFDATIGANGERSSAVVSLSYSNQDAIFAADRHTTKFPVFGEAIYHYASNSPFPGQHFQSDCAALLAGAPDPYNVGQFCGSSSSAYGRFTVTGLGGTRALTPGQDGRDASDFHAFNNTDRYNFAPVNYLQQPQTKQNVFAAGHFDITDNIQAYARASYTKRTSSQQLAEVPATFADNGSFGPQWAFGVAANNVFNPFGARVTRGQFRNVAVGPRHNNYDVNTWGVNMGLEGNFQIGDRYFNWDVMAARNDSQYRKVGLNYINLFNLKNALGPSRRNPVTNALECLDSGGAVIRGCVPYNVFGGPDLGLGAGVISPEEYEAMINYVSYTQVGAYGNVNTNYTANISGDLFELPGGMMGFALGWEYRKDSAFNQPDTLVASGGSSDNFTEPTHGETLAKEYYLEFVAPLLKDLPGAKELELSAAARKSDFSASGFIGTTASSVDVAKPLTKKFGLKWKPIDDLLVRASWGQTFRAPSASDLYSGGTENFPAAVDPCSVLANSAFSDVTNPNHANAVANCTTAGVAGAPQGNAQIRALGGGNPSLVPEHGTNFTAGIVYSPSWVEGLDITVDYWRVNLKDAISTQGANFIMQSCYLVDPSQFNLADQFCNKIERSGTGEISTIRTAQFNASSFRISGVDLGVGYRLDTDSFGRFRFKLDSTFITKNEFNGFDLRRHYNGSPNWNNRSQLDVAWNMGDWDANWTMRYTSDIFENCFFYCNQHDGDGLNHTGGVVYHDVQVGWKAPWKAHISVGARNVFGKEPPVLTNNTFAQSFDASYDTPGGAFWYAQYRQDF